jgi:hypothetical protein
VTAEATFDLTLADCCDRWGISRNAVKSRAAALGVELRRESSTRTVWPGEDLALGDRLHDHLRQGGTLASFPEALPPAGGTSDRSLAPAGASSDTPGGLSLPPVGATSGEAIAALILAAREALPPDPLAVPRALAAAADEALPLTSAELAHLLGESVEALEQRRAGFILRGFRLERRGRGEGRAWYVTRAQQRHQPGPAAVASLTPAGAASDSRTVGFGAALDVEWRAIDDRGSRLFAQNRIT